MTMPKWLSKLLKRWMRPRFEVTPTEICYKHYWGVGDPLVPCPKCGYTVEVIHD